MIRRGAPRAFQKFYGAKLLKRNAAPVGRRAGRLQATFAFSTELIAQDPKLPSLVPPQPVWTKQPIPLTVHSGDGRPMFHRPPDQTINFFNRLSCAT